MPNITIRIEDAEIIRRAKVLAAERGTTLSAMFRAYLLDFIGQSDGYDLARKRALRSLRQGLPLGGRPLSRDEVYQDRSGPDKDGE